MCTCLGYRAVFSHPILSRTKDVLVQSAAFQIYAPNATQNTIPPPTLTEAAPTTTTTVAGYVLIPSPYIWHFLTSHASLRPVVTPFSISSTLDPSSGVADQPASTSSQRSPSSSSRNTSIIVGATIGSVVFVLLIIGTLYQLSRRKASKTNSTTEVVPFSMTQPTSGSASSLLLPSSLLKPTISPRAAQVAANRAEVLRRERERLDREIAALEGSNRSLTRRPDVVGAIDGGRSRANIDVHSQLEILRAQVRRLETTVDGPPGYQ